MHENNRPTLILRHSTHHLRITATARCINQRYRTVGVTIEEAEKEAQAFLETRYMEDDNIGPIGGVEHTCDTVYSLGIRLCRDFFCRDDVLDPEE